MIETEDADQTDDDDYFIDRVPPSLERLIIHSYSKLEGHATRQLEHLARNRDALHRNVKRLTVLTGFDSPRDQRHSLPHLFTKANCLHAGFKLEEGELPKDELPMQLVFETPSMLFPPPQHAKGLIASLGATTYTLAIRSNLYRCRSNS
jgi:hypothetical protein